MSLIREITRGDSSSVAAEQSGLPHILLVVDQFPKTLGGGERIVLRLAALLPSYGYRVSILTFLIHPETSGLASASCPIYLLPLTKTYDLRAFRAAAELRRFFLQHKVDIVQTFFESSDLWAGLVAKLTPGVKLIWSRRDMGILRGSKHRVAYRLMSRAPDAVFAVSEQVRRHAIEVDRIPPERVRTIYNGLDLAEWDGSPGIERGRTPFVATVGNVRRVKGHDVLIRAAAVVRREFPDATFGIVGDVLEPAYFDELTVLIRDLKLSDHCHFYGGVTDLRQHLQAADVFVLPSRSEGFSNAILEAMAASLPVVATDVGGNAEAVQSGVNGWIVPSEDPEALAKAITKLLADPALARRMGQTGKELAAERFTTAAMMKRITREYEALLKPESSPKRADTRLRS